jgi:hypothetical protein
VAKKRMDNTGFIRNINGHYIHNIMIITEIIHSLFAGAYTVRKRSN